jgi:hypothetical protein
MDAKYGADNLLGEYQAFSAPFSGLNVAIGTGAGTQITGLAEVIV